MALPLHPSPGGRPRAADRLGVALLGFAVLALAGVIALACALPGQPVRVLPAVSGVVRGGGTALELIVMHRDTPSLHARRAFALGPDGRFRFDPILLDVAGHEFSKRYRVYLHLVSGRSDRVIWRAELSRLEDETPIRLACDLARPIELGQPCRVEDPLTQPWLLAEGLRQFQRLCADCHGADGRGAASPRAAAGSGAAGGAPDLTGIAARRGGRFERDEIAAWIEGRSLPPGHARGDMPVWGERLSSDFERHAEGDELIGATLDPLVAWLERLQRSD
jgi:mono/diheme cytochrome c family protein